MSSAAQGTLLAAWGQSWRWYLLSGHKDESCRQNSLCLVVACFRHRTRHAVLTRTGSSPSFLEPVAHHCRHPHALSTPGSVRWVCRNAALLGKHRRALLSLSFRVSVGR